MARPVGWAPRELSMGRNEAYRFVDGGKTSAIAAACCAASTAMRFTRRTGPFTTLPPTWRVPGPLREWQLDGIIAHLFDPAFARKVLSLRKPLVNTTSTLTDLGMPVVEVDHRQVGRLAARHFLIADSNTLATSAALGRGFPSIASKASARCWPRRDSNCRLLCRVSAATADGVELEKG